MTETEYLNNREAYITRAKKSYFNTFNSAEQRLHRMIVEAKSRAKKRGLEFSISVEDVVWNDVCPVLKIPIAIQRNKGRGGDDNSPSLDRVDNTRGYIPGNVRIISNRANKLKNNMTLEECSLLIENWYKL